MIKNISNLGDAAVYCDFGDEVNKEINSKVINYFQNLKDCKFEGITNLTPSYNKLIVSFDLSITNFEKTKKIIEKYREELSSLYSSKFDLIFDHKLKIDEIKTNEIVQMLESKSEEKLKNHDYRGAIKALRRAEKYLSN